MTVPHVVYNILPTWLGISWGIFCATWTLQTSLLTVILKSFNLMSVPATLMNWHSKPKKYVWPSLPDRGSSLACTQHRFDGSESAGSGRDRPAQVEYSELP